MHLNKRATQHKPREHVALGHADRRWLKTTSDFAVAVMSMLKMVWTTDRIATIGLFVLEIAQGLLPLATAWVMKSVFDLLAQSFQNGTLRSSSLPEGLVVLLMFQVFISIVSYLPSPASGYLTAELGRKLGLRVQSDVFRKVSSFVGLKHFEDSKFQNTIHIAAANAQHGPIQTVRIFMVLLRGAITIGAFIGIVSSLSPMLAILVSLAVLPQLGVQIKTGKQRFGLTLENSLRERRASYYGQILTGLQFAKETRLYNLDGYFLRAFQHAYRGIHDTLRGQQLRELGWQVALAGVSSLTSGVAFIAVILTAFSGQLSFGDIVLYTSAVANIQSSLSAVVFALGNLNESVLFHKHYRDLLSTGRSPQLTAKYRSVPALKTGIELRNISFRYFGSDVDEWILRNLNLRIPAGQCTALIGINGSGKSTLAKLLTRMYDPDEGQILWDDIDIREFDPQELRQHIGAMFQDFVRYDLAAQENIGCGQIDQVHDEPAIQRAAMKAGAHSAVEALPRGYDTILSRWLADEGDGTDLSGGEWQKIALARMFMRDADFLILDEPTAALDAEAEYDLYHRFLNVKSGKTMLLIAHRFSTVRAADIIAVLDGGYVTEYGTHDELFAASGMYARLYGMQAEAYASVCEGNMDPERIPSATTFSK